MNQNDHEFHRFEFKNIFLIDSSRNRRCLDSAVDWQPKCEWNLQPWRSDIPYQCQLIRHRKSSCTKLLSTCCCQQEGITFPSWRIPHILHPCRRGLQGKKFVQHHWNGSLMMIISLANKYLATTTPRHDWQESYWWTRHPRSRNFHSTSSFGTSILHRSFWGQSESHRYFLHPERWQANKK